MCVAKFPESSANINFKLCVRLVSTRAFKLFYVFEGFEGGNGKYQQNRAEHV